MAVPSLPAPARQPRQSVMRRHEERAGWLFVLPAVVGLLVFTTYPVLATVYLSFTDFAVLRAPNWVGLQNYVTMLSADPDFWSAVSNSAYYAVISVVVGLAGSLGLALLMNLPTRAIGVYRTLFYLPGLVPPVAGTIVFLLMLDPDAGLVNVALRAVGLPGPAWFVDPNWAKPALILLSLWGMGTAALIFLAGLQEIPQSLIEAAMIDGAGPLQRFWRITIPLLSPVILFNLVMGIIYSFQVFTQALVIGGPTGLPVGATLMFMVLIYRTAFNFFQMGYAAALSVALFLVIVVITLVIFRAARVWVFYEAGDRAV